MIPDPVLKFIAAILILFVLVVTWISTHPPKPPHHRHAVDAPSSSPQDAVLPHPSPSPSQPYMAAPSPIPHGQRLIIVIILIVATVATIIRYALTH